MHNVITNAWRGDPYPIDTLLIFMANMAWNSTMNTSEVRKMLNDKRRGTRRVQDSVPRRLRRLPVGDDGVRRPRAARHDLPRAPRRDVDPRPADLRVRRADRFGARAGRAADRRMQAVPGSADRARVAGCKFPAFVNADGSRKFTRLSRLHHQLRDRARLGHRLPVRLARQGRRQVHARRAEPAPVGDVREEQLRLPPQAAAVVPVHAQLEPRLHGVGAARAHPPLRRPDPDPASIRKCCRSSASRRRASGPGRQPPEHLRERVETLLRSAAVLLRAARSAGRPTRALSRSTR